jgi:hypothetical protein
LWNDLSQEPAHPLELSEELQGRLIEQIARKVVSSGWAFPGALFLEMYQPLSFLGGQFLLLTAPLTYPFAGAQRVENLAAVLGSRDAVNRLIHRIEELCSTPTTPS